MPVESKEEISHLFSLLETSGCEFYRNGSWHTGRDASAHLKKKFQWGALVMPDVAEGIALDDRQVELVVAVYHLDDWN